MVSDQEIANCVESILRQCPPDPTLTTTTSSTSSTPAINVTGVVQQLEAKLGLDLSHKAGFIRDHISLLLRPPPKDHFALQQQQQQQQQQQFLQQQYLGGGYLQHQMMQQQQHQIQQSPFTHLPHQHELTFRCAPPVQMQRQQQQVAAAAAAATSVMQKQEGNALAFAPGSSGPVAPAKGSGQSGKRRGGPGGLNKVCGVSPELQAIVGEPTMARTQIVKQLWAYIRKNNLQDPNNKRKIICNDELRLVFETDCTDMFKMNKLLAKHIIPLEPAKEPGPDTKKIKTADAVSVSEPVMANQPVTLSDALAEFFGTGETQMLQSEALKRIWQVIIWWAGLMRGAVSVALAFNQFTLSGVTWDTVHATMITSTLVVVLFTTLVFGLLTKPLIVLLLPRHDHHSSHHMNNTPKDDVIVPLLSLEESAETTFLQVQNSLSMLFERPVHTIHFYWRKFDDTYMRPVFGGPVCAVSRRASFDSCQRDGRGSS